MKNNKFLRRKNKRKSRYRRRRVDRTTLIIGMKCPEGVALVADTKVFDMESARATYEKKIIAPPLSPPVYVGAAGLTDLFREFNRKIPIIVGQRRREIAIKNQRALREVGLNLEDFLKPAKKPEKIQSVEEPKKGPPKEPEKEKAVVPPYAYTGEHLLDDCKQLIKKISEEKKELGYSYPLEVLLGFIANDPVLFYVDCDGSEREIDTYQPIGSGSQYVKLFFDRLWNPNKSIWESITLACFVIKFVEGMGLDNYVGVGKDNLPQIALILNDGRIGEFEVENKQDVIDKIIDPKIKQFGELIVEGLKDIGKFTI